MHLSFENNDPIKTSNTSIDDTGSIPDESFLTPDAEENPLIRSVRKDIIYPVSISE
jgi:hypothetical protein